MFKRITSLVLALALCLCMVPQFASAAESKTYLALGDSISAGVTLENPQAEAFTALLKNNLGDDYQLINMAAPEGETTQKVLEKLETADCQAAVIQADVITITIGGNDMMALFYEFLAGQLGMTVEELKTALSDGTELPILMEASKVIAGAGSDFEIPKESIAVIVERHRAMIAAVRALNPTAALVVSTQYNPYKHLVGQVKQFYALLPFLGQDYVVMADAIFRISEVIENALATFNSAVKEGTGYGVADLYTAFQNSNAQLCNAALVLKGVSLESVNMDFHPNAAGHKVIADSMTAAVKAELEKVPAPTDYAVSFDANGGSGSMKPVYASGSYTLPVCSFTAPAGKIFAGWAVSPEGPVLSEAAVEVTADITLYAIWADCAHTGGTATCTQQAVCEACGEAYGSLAPHSWDEGTVTQEPTEDLPGVRTFTCGVCGATKTVEIPALQPKAEVTRVAGSGRAETAIAAANELKKVLGVEKFNTIILASGGSFADALTGSYLGVVTNAPILLHHGKSQAFNLPYILQNLTEGGTVYILGGEAAVPMAVQEDLHAAGVEVCRLAGSDRFLTNLEILAEAGIGDQEILIASGWVFADSLSLSATGLPVLMVNTNKNALTEDQIAFLTAHKTQKITIAGGEAAVSAELEAAIEAIVGKDVGRVYGEGREATSVAIAKTYFPTADFAVVAYSRNFPDGLSGGPLAYFRKAPMLLTTAAQAAVTNACLQDLGITSGYIMGGSAVLTDDTARAVFGLAPDAIIPNA